MRSPHVTVKSNGAARHAESEELTLAMGSDMSVWSVSYSDEIRETNTRPASASFIAGIRSLSISAFDT